MTIYWISVIAGLIWALQLTYDEEHYKEIEKVSGLLNPVWIVIGMAFIPLLNTWILIGYIRSFFQLIYETIIEFKNKDKK